MAKPVWKIMDAGATSPYNDVMQNGAFVGAMSETRFSLGHGANKIVFSGQFTLNGSGVIVDGTITGFKLYAGGELQLSTSGYAIDFNELGSALESLREFDDAAPLGNLLFAGGMVMKDLGGDSHFAGTPFADVLFGNDGMDHLEGLGGADEIHGGGGADNLEGGAGKDTIYGDSGGDTIYGDAQSDRLFGGKGHDTMSGGLGRDILDGGSGDDFLNGDADADTLTGGAGHDTFVFDNEFVAGMPVDHITDFEHGIDLIGIHGTTAGLPTGDLAKAAFYVGQAAHDADDRIIYNKAKGALYYDPDGQGGADQVKFAVLDNHPSLNYHDFVVLA